MTRVFGQRMAVQLKFLGRIRRSPAIEAPAFECRARQPEQRKREAVVHRVRRFAARHGENRTLHRTSSQQSPRVISSE